MIELVVLLWVYFFIVVVGRGFSNVRIMLFFFLVCFGGEVILRVLFEFGVRSVFVFFSCICFVYNIVMVYVKLLDKLNLCVAYASRYVVASVNVFGFVIVFGC